MRLLMEKSWHQDVKPENILIVREHGLEVHKSQFKLADLGLSHFHPCMDEDGEILGPDAQGTRTYGKLCLRSVKA